MVDDRSLPLLSRLVALGGEVRPPDYPLATESCMIGRASSCQIVVPRQVVSRLHALVVRDGQRYVLRDAGSINGTYVNGRRLTAPHQLSDRDEIGLGAPAPLLRFVDPDPTLVQESLLRYDERTMRFFLGQRPVELAPSELRLLRHLYEHAGAVCARERCAEAVWGAAYPPGAEAGALDRVMANLRAKLRRTDPDADLIRARRGLGFELIL